MQFKKRILALALLISSQFNFAQEGMAVYSDYLTDNYYLIHPSMAGAANCAKVRLTARQQWVDSNNSPMLQTLSFNMAAGERSGIGLIALNDRNGYHSQTGVKLTYAHHLLFSRDRNDLNMLSFGLSAGMVQSRLDETEFTEFDPIVHGGMTQKDSYFNVDLGASYHYLDFFAHLTVKNLLATKRDIYSDIESDNLRKYLLSVGYIFGDSDRIQLEPSIMFQYVDETKEKTLDMNLKAYKDFSFGKLWAGLSYRRSFDKTQYLSSGTTGKVEEQSLQYLSPLVGINYKNFMFAYTYSHLMGDIKYDSGGFHQITLGINLFCKKEKWDCNCPAVN